MYDLEELGAITKDGSLSASQARLYTENCYFYNFYVQKDDPIIGAIDVYRENDRLRIVADSRGKTTHIISYNEEERTKNNERLHGKDEKAAREEVYDMCKPFFPLMDKLMDKTKATVRRPANMVGDKRVSGKGSAIKYVGAVDADVVEIDAVDICAAPQDDASYNNILSGTTHDGHKYDFWNDFEKPTSYHMEIKMPSGKLRLSYSTGTGSISTTFVPAKTGRPLTEKDKRDATNNTKWLDNVIKTEATKYMREMNMLIYKIGGFGKSEKKE